MADKKASAFTELTALSYTDKIIILEDIGSGNYVTKNITIQNVINKVPITTKTTTYTTTDDDYIILCDASGGAFSITLPTASGRAGKGWIIKKIDSSVNAVTIDPNGAETVDGSATLAITTQYVSKNVVSDNTNYHVVN